MVGRNRRVGARVQGLVRKRRVPGLARAGLGTGISFLDRITGFTG